LVLVLEGGFGHKPMVKKILPDCLIAANRPANRQ